MLANTLRDTLKDYFKDRHDIIDQVYSEFYLFWSPKLANEDSGESSTDAVAAL